MPTSIFSDEWRECLVAHYTHVLRSSDQRTERTLRGVMLDAGFTEDDLSRIYLAATAHVDDVPDDFTPDARFLESVAVPEAVAIAPTAPDELPASSTPPIAGSFIDDSPFETSFDDTDSQELLPLDESDIEDELPENEPQDDEASTPPPDPDVTQLSLF